MTLKQTAASVTIHCTIRVASYLIKERTLGTLSISKIITLHSRNTQHSNNPTQSLFRVCLEHDDTVSYVLLNLFPDSFLGETEQKIQVQTPSKEGL